MKPSHGPDEAEAAPAGPIDESSRVGELEARLASLEAHFSEQGGRLAATEAAASELRAANEALARELAAVKKAHDVCLFFERRRDCGAELPAGVLLNIMDHVPDIKCVSLSCFDMRSIFGYLSYREQIQNNLWYFWPSLLSLPPHPPFLSERPPTWPARAAASGPPTPRACGPRSTPQPAMRSSLARAASGASCPPATTCGQR